MVWLGIPLSILVALITCVLFTQQTKDLVDYQRCVWWHGLAAVLEMLTEPLYILTIREMSFGVRLCVEGLAHLVRCVLTYVLIVSADLGLMAFAFAQIAFSLVLIAGYYGRYILAIRRGQSLLWYSSLLFPFMQAAPDTKLAYLVLSFKLVTAVKFVLTEGEKIVLLLFVPLDAHAVGVFAIVSNLGSLVARFLLQPIEEISLSLFSRLGSARAGQATVQLTQLSLLLRHLMLAVCVLGLLLISFGPNYAFLLFHLLYGSKWSQTDAPAVLSWYCVYVLLIAINGVSEAFVHATINADENVRLNIVLTAISVVYLALTAVLGAWLGPAGLIAANCVNMAARILYSAHYTHNYFRPLRTFRLRSLIPNAMVLLAFAICFAVTHVSARLIAPGTTATGWKSHALHVAVGVACVGAVVAVVWHTERAAVREMRAMWTNRRKAD